MLVPFNTLPDSARVWIYQANRSFTEEEIKEIEHYLGEFITGWTAHGSQLKAGFEIKYRRFIIIALDQSHAGASGCSIDASVHFIQGLETKYKVNLMDRMNVSFKQGEYVAYKPLKDFKKMAKNKSISKDTVVFNNLVTNKQEYLEHWEVPASESWHARFI
ncbi:ABC transporter ATPase [Flagellimonas allohymeniacidonis]|uniref:ABC transporter ATPase n=1 Tax=Flagellimonas allohymeniacidonis TaxID=2517819 RepID=A0A4V2HSP7_9FLAO|nr:ABC transporter ATPase [Allomuricauda hymeniacidonis]TAI48550.1 ABC transporter ATPase [Allomuricauda hymeniacidonis]